MNEHLGVLHTLTLTGKAGFEKRNNQLLLIQDCYSGQENVVSELLKVRAPDEISPLFTLKTVGIPHQPLPGLCGLYWRFVL